MEVPDYSNMVPQRIIIIKHFKTLKILTHLQFRMTNHVIHINYDIRNKKLGTIFEIRLFLQQLFDFYDQWA